MLSEIMKAFRETGGPLDLSELARRLGTDRAALEGMLETLVRQGKLKAVIPGSEDCTLCNDRASCEHVKGSHTLGKVYELAEST